MVSLPSLTPPSSSAQRIVLMLLTGAAAALFFSNPFVLLLLLCLCALASPIDEMKWLFLASACAAFTALNLAKDLDGDLIAYVSLQDYIAQHDLLTLFNKDELRVISGTYRATEIGYYLPMWLLSFVFTDSKSAISVAGTLAIYVPTFTAINLIGRRERWSNGLILTVAAFTFFAGVNFIQTTHLIRQYISCSLLLLSFVLFLSRRGGWAAFVALYACLVHNGSGPLLPLLVFVCWLFRYERHIRPGSFLLRVLVIATLLLIVVGAVPILQGEFVKEEVPNIKPLHFILVGAFFVLVNTLLMRRKVHLESLHYARLIFIIIYVLSLGFFLLGLPLFALRYFAYLEWLYGLLVGAAIMDWFRRQDGLRLSARMLVTLAAMAILIERVTVSEWMYGPDNYFLSWNYFQVAQLISF